MKCEKCGFENPANSQFCNKCGTQNIHSKEDSSPQTRTLKLPVQKLSIGSTFGGRYQVVEQIGIGGMGKVYKVFDKEIKEMVALKLLNPLIAADEKMIERFRNELKLARKISHKHICRVYHLGDEEGSYYITMEYVPGEDLKSLIRKIGHLSVGKAVSIAKQCYEGLAEAHKLGIVHRDLKPQNLMIDEGGNVRIMDFGIARFQESRGITDTGTTLGTPEYMSPEQVEGEEVDPRSDIYSSGVILYEMLTGDVPFGGKTPLSIAVKQKTEFPREPKAFNPQIPDELNQLVMRCLEKNREKRYQNADEILNGLNRIKEDIPTKEMVLERKTTFFWAFLRKLKKRKIIHTLAAFIGGGAALLEFTHLTLVGHYHLPEVIVNYIIGVLLLAMLSTVSWQWFRGEAAVRRKVRRFPKIKFKWIAAMIAIALLVAGGYRIWKGALPTEADYADYILLNIEVDDSEKINKSLVEYLLLRSLEASTESRILVQEDYTTYKKRTESEDDKLLRPVISINADVYSKATGFEDFDIRIEMNSRGETTGQTFECKGPRDLISNKIDKIHSFISNGSDEKIGKIEGERTFSQICTENWEALDHFLKGEKAWRKLKTVDAAEEYKKAIDQYDTDFSLAYLKLAAVAFFDDELDKAEEYLQKAEERSDKLIKYDMTRLQALKARIIESDSGKDRQCWGQLVESFPYNKEYHYELGEAYFQYGDGKEAIEHYKKALYIDPNYPLPYNHMGLAYSWLGKHDEALNHLNKYVQLDETENSYDSLAIGYMFAGRYDDGIEAINKALAIEKDQDYLYTRKANNCIFKGALAKASENVKKLAEIAAFEQSETIEYSAKFQLAFIEFLRGNFEKSMEVLKEATDFYSSETHNDRVNEASNLPFWLKGLIVFERGDIKKLSGIIKLMETRMANHEEKTQSEISAINYSQIYKLYIHLEILEACLREEKNEVLRFINEGQKISEKMGFWASMFNLYFFYDKYAEVLIKMNMLDPALELLNKAIEYNPNYASARINLARIHLLKKNIEQARVEHQKAKELLSDADSDFVLVKIVEEIGTKLSSRSLDD